MHNFYSTNIGGKSLLLDEQESAHAIRVLRLKEGAIIRVTDGRGTVCRARITRAHARSTEAVILDKETHSQRAPWQLHIAIAPVKNTDRFALFLEKVTETGVDEITPLLCENSERKKLRHDRLERVLVAAMKQSGQPFLPRLHPLTTLEIFLKTAPPESDRLIAHCCEHADNTRRHLYDSISRDHVVLLIGPEGDFSAEEIRKAHHAGFHSVSLGNTRLRTETAGIAAAMITATKFRGM